MEDLRLGLLGCGRVAQRIHLPLLRRIPKVRVAALADVDPGHLDRARQAAPGCVTHDTAESLFAQTELDAVLIALPSDQHAQAAEQALQQGLHVYVEKPLALDLDQADGLVEAARRSDRTFRVGLNYRFHPAVRELRRTLRAGALGAVLGVQTVFASPSRGLPEWKCRRATGGGVLLDLGVHHFDLLTFLLEARPREIAASLRSREAEQDFAQVTLRFDEVDAQVMVSIGAAEMDRIEVLGTAGRLRLDRFASPVLSWSPERRDHSLGGRLRELGGSSVGLRSSVARVLRPRREPSYEIALREFVQAALGGPSADEAPTAQVGRDALALVLAAEEAAASGRPVSL